MATGTVLLISGVSDEDPAERRPPQAGSVAVDSSRLSGASAVPALPPAEPVRLRIGAIGVNAPMARVGLDAAGGHPGPAPGRPRGARGVGARPGTRAGGAARAPR
ncbi:class F sortase, partial [Streptomyces bauhiniae]